MPGCGIVYTTDYKETGLGKEDLLLGFGKVTQIRNRKKVELTKINGGEIPFDNDKSISDKIKENDAHLLQLDPYGRQGVSNSVQRNFGEWNDAYVNRDVSDVALPGQSTTIKQRIVFQAGDITTHNGNTWVAIQDNPDGEPGVVDGWELLATKRTTANGNALETIVVGNDAAVSLSNSDGDLLSGIKLCEDGKLLNLVTGLEIPDYQKLNYTTDNAADSLIGAYKIGGATSGLDLELGILELDGFVLGNTATVSYKVELKGFNIPDSINQYFLCNINILKPLYDNSIIKDIKEKSYSTAGIQPYTVNNVGLPIVSSWALFRKGGTLFNQPDFTPAKDGGGSTDDINRVVYVGTVVFEIERD